MEKPGEMFAVRVRTSDGSIADLMHFAIREQAENYKRTLQPLPLGFEEITIVPKLIVGVISTAASIVFALLTLTTSAIL